MQGSNEGTQWEGEANGCPKTSLKNVQWKTSGIPSITVATTRTKKLAMDLGSDPNQYAGHTLLYGTFK
jgi:hypothetical protein